MSEGSEGWRSSLSLWTPGLSLRGAVRPRWLAVAGFCPAVRKHTASYVDKLAQRRLLIQAVKMEADYRRRRQQQQRQQATGGEAPRCNVAGAAQYQAKDKNAKQSN